MINFTVNARILKSMAKHIAPKKAIRYYLNGVCIQARPDAIYYIATNGHMLAAAREPYAEGDTPPDTAAEYIFPREPLAKMKCGKLDLACLRIEGEEFSIGDDALTFGKLIDAKYPDWRSIMPRQCSGDTAHYDPHYLAAMLDCFRDCYDLQKVFLTQRMNGNSASVLVGGGFDFVGVIMPMRDGTEFSIPDWAHTEQSVTAAQQSA
jgi:DNA polymerase III subunit beta